MIDAHVHFLKDSIHNIWLMITGLLPRQGGEREGENYNGLTTELFSQSANGLIRRLFGHLAFTLAFNKVMSSRNNCPETPAHTYTHTHWLFFPDSLVQSRFSPAMLADGTLIFSPQSDQASGSSVSGVYLIPPSVSDFVLVACDP